jgi:hypothetical protein
VSKSSTQRITLKENKKILTRGLSQDEEEEKRVRVEKQKSLEDDIYCNHMDSSDSYEFSSSDEENLEQESKTERLESDKLSLEAQQEQKKHSIKDYEQLGVLGEGAFGKVFHMVRKSDGEQFAIKVLSK